VPCRPSRERGEAGHAEVCGTGLTLECCVDLGQLVLDAAVADLEPLDLAEPAFAFGLNDPDHQIIADLFQS
jgi:hypothetical protein